MAYVIYCPVMDIYPGKTDRLVFEHRSNIQEIKVFDKLNGFRYLLLNGVHHGGHLPGRPGTLVLPYFKSATASLAFMDEPSDFLFIGLGMGALPAFLREVMPSVNIDVVEIDPDVIRAAKEHFGFFEEDRLKVYTGDGREFVRLSRKKYDAVFLDAYQDVSVPKHLTSLEFMREVRGILKPGGVAVSNLWGSVVNKCFEACVRTIQEAFTHLYQFKSYTYNYIFVADTKEDEIPAHELLVRAKAVASRVHFGYSLVDLVRKQYKSVPKDEFERAEVIRDEGITKD